MNFFMCTLLLINIFLLPMAIFADYLQSKTVKTNTKKSGHDCWEFIIKTFKFLKDNRILRCFALLGIGILIGMQKFYSPIIVAIVFSIVIIIFTIWIYIKVLDWLSSINKFFQDVDIKYININYLILAYFLFIYQTLFVVFMLNFETELKDIMPYINKLLWIFPIMLSILYVMNFIMLANLITRRSKIILYNNKPQQNACKKIVIISIMIVIAFCGIFSLINILMYILNTNGHYFSEPNVSYWNIIYYSISTFLTFCAENITANHWTSQLICLCSKITTIFSVTILLSVLTGILPDNNDENTGIVKNHKSKIRSN